MTVAEELRAIADQVMVDHGEDPGIAVVASLLHTQAGRLESCADYIRMPVTMHICSECGVGHSTREKGFMEGIADTLAPPVRKP